MSYKSTGRPVGKQPMPIGTQRVYTHPDGSKATWVKGEKGWSMVPGSYVPSEKPRKNAKIGPVVQDVAGSISGQPRASEVAKKRLESRRQTHHKSRPALVVDKNPGTIVVKKDAGGCWVRVDGRTIVYKKNHIS